MEICKSTLDNFQDDSVLDAFAQHLNIDVFDSKKHHIRRVDDIRKLNDLAESDMLLMPAEHEALLALRPPKKVSASDFKPIYLNPDHQRQFFHRINFTVKLSKDDLSIWYDNEKIYDEPIYLMLRASDDMEEEAFIFENRIQYLFAILKGIYGSKAKLQCAASYPAVSATKDLWLYVSEQVAPALEQRGYSLTLTLKIMLTIAAKEKEQLAFMEAISSDVKSIEEMIDTLFQEYVNYCSISKGYRTAIWDSMVGIYSYFKPELSHEAILNLLDERFTSKQCQHLMSYDLAITTPLESMKDQIDLFIHADADCKTALAFGLICFCETMD